MHRFRAGPEEPKVRRWSAGKGVTVTTAHHVALNLVVGDDVDKQILFDRTFEPRITALIRSLLEGQRGTVLDVGWHLDYYATLAGKIAPGMSLIAYDANPVTVVRCRQNLVSNTLEGTVENLSVGSAMQCCSSTSYDPTMNLSCHSLARASLGQTYARPKRARKIGPLRNGPPN